MVKVTSDQKTLKDELKNLKAKNVLLEKNIGILSGELNKQSNIILEAEIFKKEKNKLMKRLKRAKASIQDYKIRMDGWKDQAASYKDNIMSLEKDIRQSEKDLDVCREKLSKSAGEVSTLKGQKRKLEKDAEGSKKKMQRLEGIRNYKVLAEGIEFMRKAQECFSTTGLVDTIKQKTKEDLLSEATEMGYICTITQEMFVDPVRCVDEHVYERKMIEQWFKHRNTSPNTNATILDKTLVTDYRLKSQIEAWKKINNYDEIVAKENTVDLTKNN